MSQKRDTIVMEGRTVNHHHHEQMEARAKRSENGELGQRKTGDNDDDAVDWVDEGETEEEARVELGLVGKLWTQRHINANAFMATMKNVWQPNYGVDISSLGENTFVFQFHHWRDKKRVVDGHPWHFDKHAIILGDIEGNTKPSDMLLYELPMWVRVYNLPFKGRLNLTNVEALGNKLGTFIKVDNSGSIGIDKSIRLRVNIDVRKPLVRTVKVKMRGGMEEFYDVKYERPPIFCYYCGKIGHGLKDCYDCREEEDPTLGYGGWLKASPWKRNLQEENITKREGQLACARSLFITKPRVPCDPKINSKVLEVAEQLNACALKPTIEMKENTASKAVVTSREEIPQACEEEVSSTKKRGKEKKSQVKEVRDGGQLIEGEVVREMREGDDVIMGDVPNMRRWKRVKKPEEGENKKETKLCGRRLRECIEEESSKEGHPKTNKKLRENEEHRDIPELQVSQSLNVAGPTTWALGGQ